MSKLVIFSGSFNPPTIAHKTLMTSAIDGTGSDLGFFVPANDTYVRNKMSKTDWPSEVLSERTRAAMLNALCAGDERLSVNEGEYACTGTSGNGIETMTRMQAKYPNSELFFLFGGDELKSFRKWKAFGELGENCRIVLFRSEDFDPEQEIGQIKALRGLRDRFVILPVPEGISGITSAAARDAVRKGDDETVSSMLIPEIIALLARSPIHKETAIRSFRGRYAFLSNFYKAEVTFEEQTYPTGEAAFQAAKCLDPRARISFTLETNPVAAKRMGRQVKLRPDWEKVKVGIMETIVRAKFTQNPNLAEKLVATGSLPIMEGNNWRDTFWGVDASTGRGENHLGKILMKIRGELGGAGDTSAEAAFAGSANNGSAASAGTSGGNSSSSVLRGSGAGQPGRPAEEPAPGPKRVYEVGMKLLHPAFGTGTITAAGGTVLSVEFPEVGVKKLGSVWVDNNCTIVTE